MPHKALTVINLPVMEDREIWPEIVVPVPTGAVNHKEPGDTITKKELSDAGQTDAMIAGMIEFGSLSELDAMDTPLHPDHQNLDTTEAAATEATDAEA